LNYIREEAPEIVASFYQLTKSISSYAPFDEKTKEIILCSVFAAQGPSALRGLGTHVARAFELGASKQEILGSILLIMPVVGVTLTTAAIDKAEEVLRNLEPQGSQD
jgi:alkylhydroperoxidase/carboxymuconolactone decarboxylase family protein YurZ